MSEDYDDVTYGPITLGRAKHHCKCLAVDCDWRASEVDEYVDAQEKIIALLRAEVRAWRDADESRDEERLPWDKAQAIIKAMNATDAAGALEE